MSDYKHLFTDKLSDEEIVDMLNGFTDEYQFIEEDHYLSGDWLHAAVSKAEVGEKLQELIVDLDAYREANNSIYSHSSNPDEIGLSLLVDQSANPIKYDRKCSEYYLYF